MKPLTNLMALLVAAFVFTSSFIAPVGAKDHPDDSRSKECFEMMQSFSDILSRRTIIFELSDASQTAALKMLELCLKKKKDAAPIFTPAGYHKTAMDRLIYNELRGASKFLNGADSVDHEERQQFIQYMENSRSDEPSFLPVSADTANLKIVEALTEREGLVIAFTAAGWSVNEVAALFDTKPSAIYKTRKRASDKIKELADNEGWGLENILSLFAMAGLGSLLIIGGIATLAEIGAETLAHDAASQSEAHAVPEKVYAKATVQMARDHYH